MGVLQGQRALVLGGTSGIGLAAARALVADGATVTIAARDGERLARVASELGVDSMVCDASEASQVKEAVDAASDDDGRLDIAVAVPGGGSITPVLMYDDGAFSAEIDSNVGPTYLALKYAGRAMIRAGGGSFVAVSSTAAQFSCRNLAAYCAAKAAVDMLVKVAADELGPHNVRVNSVRPGMTETGATRGAFLNEPMISALLAQQPLKRNGVPDDIGAAIRYLAGPESSWVTGQHLTVDGGHTLRAFIDYDALIDLPDQAAAAMDRQ